MTEAVVRRSHAAISQSATPAAARARIKSSSSALNGRRSGRQSVIVIRDQQARGHKRFIDRDTAGDKSLKCLRSTGEIDVVKIESQPDRLAQLFCQFGFEL